MNTVFRNFLAVAVGFVIGSIVNILLIELGGRVVPLPECIDTTTPEGLVEAKSLLKPQHFIFPFIAHAVGTLVGAFLAAKIVVEKKMFFGLTVGAVFLVGGILAAIMIKGPVWFTVLDLVFAYLPLAWLGAKIGGRGTRRA